jgi:hypothetical protein
MSSAAREKKPISKESLFMSPVKISMANEPGRKDDYGQEERSKLSETAVPYTDGTGSRQ